jgi:hypothetical protein
MTNQTRYKTSYFPWFKKNSADALAHSKFVGYVEPVRPLIEAILGNRGIDEGLIELNPPKISRNS